MQIDYSYDHVTNTHKMANTSASVNHVVVDSGGFIKDAPLKDIGQKIYTVPDVVREIRDKATRNRLQVLPYELQFKEPSPECIKAVTDFSKKTGDYRSLSAVDIRVMALAYQLEKECNGTDHIRTEPERKKELNATSRPLEKATDIAGFYLNKKVPSNSRTTSESQCTEEDNKINGLSEKVDSLKVDDKTNCEEDNSKATEKINETTHASELQTIPTEQNTDIESKQEDKVDQSDSCTTKGEGLGEGDIISVENLQEGDGSEEEESDNDEEEEDDEDDDDDDDGWITPSNIKAVRKAMGDQHTEKAIVEVACLTTDFAMQNILIQMGLNVISVNGMLIKKAKSYVLRCFGCMKVTTNVMKEFCPHCGNKTLQKVSMIVDSDGKIQYFLSRRKPMSTRGMKYSLPTPKGGKHVKNPILCEDQKEAQNRMARNKKSKHYNVFDPDYEANTSPFAFNDVNTKGALQRGHGKNFDKRNPNENRKVYGRRK